MIQNVINSVIVLGILSLLLGVLIILTNKVFAVKRDPLIDKLIEILPNANCGACGFPGCEQFAAELVKTKNPALRCPVGKEKVANAIKELLEKQNGE